MEAMKIANNMIEVYNSTPAERYPLARALDVLEGYEFGSHNRLQASNLFFAWLDLKEGE